MPRPYPIRPTFHSLYLLSLHFSGQWCESFWVFLSRKFCCEQLQMALKRMMKSLWAASTRKCRWQPCTIPSFPSLAEQVKVLPWDSLRQGWGLWAPPERCLVARIRQTSRQTTLNHLSWYQKQSSRQSSDSCEYYISDIVHYTYIYSMYIYSVCTTVICILRATHMHRCHKRRTSLAATNECLVNSMQIRSSVFKWVNWVGRISFD